MICYCVNLDKSFKLCLHLSQDSETLLTWYVQLKLLPAVCLFTRLKNVYSHLCNFSEYNIFPHSDIYEKLSLAYLQWKSVSGQRFLFALIICIWNRENLIWFEIFYGATKNQKHLFLCLYLCMKGRYFHYFFIL